MRFLSVAHTDMGISKNVNQDAFCLKIARAPKHNIAFAVICDGMGGLQSGELASAFVVNAFSNWFEDELPSRIGAKTDLNAIVNRWKEITAEQGRKVMDYGKERGMTLGTTLCALLIVDDEYAIIHVGDSRIYKINAMLQQLTKDQTVVAHEIEMKRMTPEQAKTDSRKNMLLQCVGATKTIVPEIRTGKLEENEAFLLCTDGFRHEISTEEIHGVLSPNLLTSERVMKSSLVDLTELVKSRGETDNITAILIKAIR